MTPKTFKMIAKKRYSSERRVMKAFIKYRTALNNYLYEDFECLIKHGDPNMTSFFLKFLRQNKEKKRKTKTRAKDALKKALLKHNLLKSSVQKKFKYDKRDKNSYNYATSLTAKETQARDKLI